MKTLYEASSAVEAHMLQDLLKQEGIAVTVQGSYLQGAIGGLPAAGLVRLLVEDESQHAAARTIIERWEKESILDLTHSPPRRQRSYFLASFVGFAVGVAASYAFFRSPVTVDGIDYNHDGVLDERSTYSPSGAMLHTEVDRNLNGKIDYIARHDQRGHIATVEVDDNFDGKYETLYRFRLGNVEYSEADTDGDGYPDLKSRFKYGVVQTAEYVSYISGRPVRVETIVLGRVVSADVDSNSDGTLDTRYEYDAMGAVLRTGPIAGAPPQ